MGFCFRRDFLTFAPLRAILSGVSAARQAHEKASACRRSRCRKKQVSAKKPMPKNRRRGKTNAERKSVSVKNPAAESTEKRDNKRCESGATNSARSAGRCREADGKSTAKRRAALCRKNAGRCRAADGRQQAQTAGGKGAATRGM